MGRLRFLFECFRFALGSLLPVEGWEGVKGYEG